MILSQPFRAASASGRRRPWVSEITPTFMQSTAMGWKWLASVSTGASLRTAALLSQRPQPADRRDCLVNRTYLERSAQGLTDAGKPVNTDLDQYLSPRVREHINLAAEYVWRQSRKLEDGQFRPLRQVGKPWPRIFQNSVSAPNLQNPRL